MSAFSIFEIILTAVLVITSMVFIGMLFFINSCRKKSGDEGSSFLGAMMLSTVIIVIAALILSVYQDVTDENNTSQTAFVSEDIGINYCSSCGAKIENIDTSDSNQKIFCYNCGTKLN